MSGLEDRATVSDPACLSSCLYAGVVTHRRYVEQPHSFRYRLFQFYLDLDEVDAVFAHRWLWSADRPAVARFRRSDHLAPEIPDLRQAVRKLIFDRTGDHCTGPIRLLTNLRYFGYVMNPVSFYYCFADDGQRIEYVVAEVHNTPWNERHCYVLPWSGDDFGHSRLQTTKEFHVSPFLPIDMQYQWVLSHPRDALNISIKNLRERELQFEANLALKRLPLSSWSMNTCLINYPWMTGKFIMAIYYQAFRLWCKGVTYYPHPRSGTR